MYYFIPLCVAVLLHGTAALDGCNDTCSSILAVNGSGEFDVDCNSGVTAEYFKCISASTGCDDIAKSRIAEHSILQYYPAAMSKERSSCRIRGTNEPEIPLITCSESGLCMCNNRAFKGTAELDVSTSGGARAESIAWGLLLVVPFIMELSNRLF
ncbi:hypothetical protein EMCRGX_G016336 [Ephydatia muelleri]